MKKIHLFAIAIIAVAIFILMSTATDASTYVTFREATARDQGGNITKVHIVGRLPKAPDGSPSGLLYDPVIDPNHFEFTLIDTLKQAQRVVYYNPKPADFDRSDDHHAVQRHFETLCPDYDKNKGKRPDFQRFIDKVEEAERRAERQW